MRCTSVNSRVRISVVVSVVVNCLNLNLFLPIIECNSSENRHSASEIQISEWVVQNFVSVLPRN